MLLNSPSHPARGAWIEICSCTVIPTNKLSRTPHGVRGLKYFVNPLDIASYRRTPHGVRGLKYPGYTNVKRSDVVAPRTGCVD